jgi:hypothetical protein
VVVLINNAAQAGDVNCDLTPLGLADGASLTDRLGAAPELHIAGGQVHAHLAARSAGVYERH